MAFDDVESHVRRRMSNTRGRDTKPELAVRRELHALGYRYRVNHRPVKELRRTADIVFTKHALAVFIDGCFWHHCPLHFRPPTTRVEFWTPKIDNNVRRDADTDVTLRAAGWRVLRFWEHENPHEVALSIARALSESQDQ